MTELPNLSQDEILSDGLAEIDPVARENRNAGYHPASRIATPESAIPMDSVASQNQAAVLSRPERLWDRVTQGAKRLYDRTPREAFWAAIGSVVASGALAYFYLRRNQAE
jgi:hypothetical protein